MLQVHRDSCRRCRVLLQLRACALHSRDAPPPFPVSQVIRSSSSGWCLTVQQHAVDPSSCPC